MPLQSEQRLNGRLVHPSSRAGVPRPAAATDVHGVSIDVGRDDVGFRPVSLRIFGRSHVINRVDHVEQLHRFVAHSEARQREDCPQSGVSILAAILPNARQIAFDIAGIVRHPIERWRQQQHNLCVATDQMCTNGIHGALGAAGLRRSGQHGP